MLGTVIYAFLDISVNLLIFTGKITLRTANYLITSVIGRDVDDLTDKELTQIRDQLKNKQTVLKELKLVHYYANKS
jgi:hypothetical protein